MKRYVSTCISAFFAITACGDSTHNIETEYLALDDVSTKAIIEFINDSSISFELLDKDVALDKRAARNIIDYRYGPDQRPQTRDDQYFSSVEELDEIPYVGQSAIASILYYATTVFGTSEQAESMSSPQIPDATYTYSQSVLDSVVRQYGITDIENLLVRSESFDNQNYYLSRREIKMAALDLQRDEKILTSYRYSSSVLAREMEANSIRDRLHLLTQAVRADADNNKYLKTAEIRAAATALTQPTPELGIISDIDRTLLPHSGDLQTYTAPFAGSAQLFDELEHEQGRKSGDTYYVTTRTPDVLGEVPQWLWNNNFPIGQIDTGVALQPWISQSEKVEDISRIINARPELSFVLFGDSSYRDPEVYAEILRRFPGRIAAIFIHRVNNVSPSRVNGMFVYEEMYEATSELFRSGIISEAAAWRSLEAARKEGANLTTDQIEAMIDMNAYGH